MALFSLLRIPGSGYWGFHPAVKEIRRRLPEFPDFDAVLSNAIEPLPLALFLAKRKPVFLDLHDYTPSHVEPGTRAGLFFGALKHWLYWKHVGQTATIFCPSQTMLRQLQVDFPEIPSFVVRNVPEYNEITASRAPERGIRLIHHGNPVRSRGILNMVEALRHLPEPFSLHFMFEDRTPSWFNKTIRESTVENRIFFHAPVAPEELPEKLSQFDVAIIWTQPSTRNNQMTLPGKLFESIHAGLAVVCSPIEDIAEVVRSKKLGLVGDSFSTEALTKVLTSLTKRDIDEFKANSLDVAPDYDGKKEIEIIRDAIRKATE